MLSGYFNIESLLDVILVPTWLHFGFQNPPKSCLGGVLGPLGRLLGGLGGVLGASRGVLELLGQRPADSSGFRAGNVAPGGGDYTGGLWRGADPGTP